MFTILFVWEKLFPHKLYGIGDKRERKSKEKVGKRGMHIHILQSKCKEERKKGYGPCTR